jgi:CubicO group peptidase (beta-lactamase class C family)
MRYAIGSVSKQFTAAAILLLQEDGKLSTSTRARSGSTATPITSSQRQSSNEFQVDRSTGSCSNASSCRWAWAAWLISMPGRWHPKTRSRCCNALGPFREAPKEARGWLFGAAQLAMTVRDLTLWNVSVMNRRLLKPESYKVLETDVLLTAGNATGYGLGVQIRMAGGRRRISHGGAVSGYTTSNVI